MLDINLFRDSPKLIKKDLEKRNQKEKTRLVDEIVKKDTKWRTNIKKLELLKKKRNQITQEITKLKQQNKSATSLIKEAKELPSKIKTLEATLDKLKKQINEDLSKVPNITHKDCPKGKSEKDNPVIKKVGKPKKLSLTTHTELAEKLNLADFDAGRSNAGKGFNYIKGDLALLDYSLQRYGVDFLLKQGFTLVTPPMMLNFKTLLGALNGLEDFEEVVYKIDKEDLYMIGTAEHSLVSMLKNKTLRKEDLPIKLCAVTPCFRKEIGGHSVDMKGLFRMHQFNKVEQVVFTTPEKSDKQLEELQKITESFFKTLEIPFQVIEICSGDLGAKFIKQYDIEAWFPRQNAYREVTSAGNCTDFQARALNIKYYGQGNRIYTHILNNTMVATSRAMVAILENHQQKDGTIKVPKALQKYMGKKIIGK